MAPTTGAGSAVVLLAASTGGTSPVSTTSDAFNWIGSSGGSWGSASNWQDVTLGQNPSTTAPGNKNAVTISGPTGSIYEVITGGGASASLSLTGLLDFIGAYTTGLLTVGAMQVASNGVTFTAGNLTLGTGSSLQASSVTVTDGSVLVSGTGAALSSSGLLTLGTLSGYYQANPSGSGYVYDPGISASLSVAAGAGLTMSGGGVIANGTLSADGAGTTVGITGNLVLGSAPPSGYTQPYSYASTGSANVSNGAAVTISGSVTEWGSSLNISGSGSTVNIAGSLTESNGSSVSVSGNSAVLNISGTLTLDSLYSGYGINSLSVSSNGKARAATLLLQDNFASGQTACSSYVAAISVDTTSSLEIGTTGTAAMGTITVDTAIGVTVNAAYAKLSGAVVDNGSITMSISGGTLSINGNLSGTGQVQIGANDTLILNGTAAATDTIAFAGAASTLTIGANSVYNYTTGSYTYTPYAVSATLSGFATGDGLLVNNVALTNAVYAYAGNNTGTLTLFAGTTTVETLKLAGNYTGRSFFISPTTSNSSAISLLAQPVGTVPSNSAVLKGVASNLPGFSVSDPNAQATGITVTLTDTIGQLAASATGGGSVAGSGTTTLTVSGTVAQVNADLATLSYTASTAGTDNIVVNSVDSLGSSGLQANVQITVLPVTPPVISVPGTSLAIKRGTNGAIAGVSFVYADGAVAGELLTATLTDAAGGLSLNTAISGGGGTMTGSGTHTLSVTGTLAQVNTDLTTLSYSSTTPGNDTISIAASGTHGGQANAASFIVQTNGMPIITAPASVNLVLGKATAVSGVSLGETPPINGETFTVDLNDTAGTLAATGSGVSGSGTSSIVISGSLSQVNADLTTLTDTPAGSAADTITITATDSYGSTANSAQIIGAVQNLAIAQILTATPITFGAVRVGTTLSKAISIRNIATAGAEGLNVTASAAGAATVSGSIKNLAAGAVADSTDIVVGLSTTSSGVESGTISLGYTSQTATGTLHQPAVSSSQIAVSATVYAEASAYAVAQSPVFHVGDSGVGEIVVSNTAVAPYSEALVATVTGSSGAISTATGSTGDIAASHSANISFVVPTTTAGTITGTTTLSYASDGTGTDGAPLASVGTQSLSLTAAVLNYAKAQVIAVAGQGILSGGNGSYTLNLGDVQQGDTAFIEELGVENAAIPVSDVLAGSVNATGDSAITFGGPYQFSGIGAQQSVNGIDLSLNTSTVGTFTKTIVIDATGSNASGYVGPDQQQTVTVTGTVEPQPGFEVQEPPTAVLHVGDSGAGVIGITNTSVAGSAQNLVATVLSEPARLTPAVNSVGPILPQGTASLDYTIDTSQSGTVEGSVDLSMTASGKTKTNDLGTFSVPIMATVYNYAKASVIASGATVTANGSNTIVNLGTVTQGSPALSVDLAIENSAEGLADRLSGSLTVTGNNGFTNSGSLSLSDIAAGYAAYVDSVTIATGTAGTFTETLDLATTGSDSGGYEGALAGQTITVEATIQAAQPPQVTVSSPAIAVQGIASTLSVSVADASAYTGEIFTATISDGSGVLAASGNGVSGSGGTTLTIAGTLSDINADLATLTDTAGTAGTDTVSVLVTDAFSNTGSASLAVTVAPLTPQLISPGTLQYSVGVATPLGVSMAEPADFVGSTVTATVSDNYGVLSAATGSGAMVTSSNGGLSLNIVGTAAQVNTALASVAEIEASQQADTVAVNVSNTAGQNATTSISLTPLAQTQSASSDTLSPVFSAILAMDSYDRGYLANVFVPPSGTGPDNQIGNKIGNAVITNVDPDENHGFYAIAYALPAASNGAAAQQVISYRGTDPNSTVNAFNDFVYGWMAGAGFLTAQATDATNFYNTVTNQTVAQGPNPGVVLVGHSLGGGLAGYIASLTGDNANVYDSMPYGAVTLAKFMAENSAILKSNVATSAISFVKTSLKWALASFLEGQVSQGNVELLPVLIDLIQNGNLVGGYAGAWSTLTGGAGGTPYAPLPNGSNVTSIYTTGEVLSHFRDGGAVNASIGASLILSMVPLIGTALATAFLAEGMIQSTASFIENSAKPQALNDVSNEISGNILNSIDLHSMAYIVIEEYAQNNVKNNYWIKIEDNLFSAYNNDAIGTALGLHQGANGTGYAAVSAQLQTMIAYSAITSGTMPYGDTGIAAMFHDANAIGQFYNADVAYPLTNTAIMNDLASIAVEFAGLLAYRQDQTADNLNGIFDYNTTEQVLEFDVSSEVWSVNGGASPQMIVGEQNLVDTLFSHAAFLANPDNIYLAAADTAGATVDLSADTGNDLIYTGVDSATFILGTGTSFVTAGSGNATVKIIQVGDGVFFTNGGGKNVVDASALTGAETIDVLTEGGQVQSLMGARETLRLDNAEAFSGAISNFATGNVIDLKDVNAKSAILGTNDNILFTDYENNTWSIQLSGSINYNNYFFDVAPDASAGTDIRVSSLSVSPTDPVIEESAGSEDFTITRKGDVSAALTVYVSTTDPDGQNTGDFIPLINEAIMFAAGSNTATFSLTLDTGDTTGESKTFGIQVTDAASSMANILGTDSFTVVSPPPPPPPPGPPTAGALGCPHFTTFDGVNFDFQGAGEFIAAKSTTTGDNFEVQMRIEPEFGVDSSVSIITQIAVQIGSDRVTFDPNRSQDNGYSGYANPSGSSADGAVVWLDGSPLTFSAGQSVITLAGGTITRISDNEYRVALNTGEVVTVNPFGDGMGLSVALPKDAAQGSVEGFLGSYNGAANSFELPDGTALGPNLTQDQLYQTFADAWRVTDSTSLFDYAAGQTTQTFTNTQYPRQILTLSDFSPALIASAAAVVAAAGITNPTLVADAEFDYITMGNPGFIVEDATVAGGSPALIAGTTTVSTSSVAPSPSIGIMAAMPEVNTASDGSASVTFDIILTKPASTDTVVNYTVTPGTGASDGRTYFTAADFGGTLPFGTVTIAAGSTSASFTVSLPSGVLGTATDKWLMVGIDSPAGDPLFNLSALSDVVSNTPVAGPSAVPKLELLQSTTPTPTEFQPSLTQNGNSYTLDLGRIALDTTVSPIQFAIANATVAPADSLASSISLTSGNGFYLYGTTLPSAIAAGSAYQGLEITPSTTTVGTNSEVLTLTSEDTNVTGYTGSLSNITLTIKDAVVVPLTIKISYTHYQIFSGGAFDCTLSYAGSLITPALFGGYVPVAAISDGGGYDVMFSNSSSFLEFGFDSAGNLTTAITPLPILGSSFALQLLEVTFGIDLNGDGTIGLKSTPLSTDNGVTFSLVANQYQLQSTAGGTVTLQFNGSPVTLGQFGDYAPIGAVAVTGGYDVAFKQASTGNFVVWKVDGSGNFNSLVTGVVSGSSYQLENLETVFNQDLNGDGTVGPKATVLSTDNGVTFSQLANEYQMQSTAGGTVTLQFNGSPVTLGQFGDYAPIGAVAVTGGYDVAFKQASTGNFVIWKVDGSGNFSSLVTGVVSGSSYQLENLETVFNQDLNGDGTVGPKATVLSTDNGVTFSQLANEYQMQSTAGGTVTLQFNGSPVTLGQFGDYAPIGAVAVTGGYDVAFKQASTGNFVVWKVDVIGNFSSLVTGVVSGQDFAIEHLEQQFNQDLNGDGRLSTQVINTGTDANLSTASQVTTVDLATNSASVTAGLNTGAISITGTPDTVMLGSIAATVEFSLTSTSGIETIAGFQYTLDDLNIDLMGAAKSALTASDITLGAQHGIAIYAGTDTHHGIVLTGLNSGLTAADLLTNHYNDVGGHAIIS